MPAARPNTGRRKGKSAPKGIPKAFRLLAWISVSALILLTAWFWWPELQWKPPPLSDHQRKLQELTRESPDAEVFELKEPQKKN